MHVFMEFDMKKFMTAMAVTTALTFGAPAYANQIGADNPETIAQLAREWATDVKVTKDGVGDPRIEFRDNNLKQEIFFYGCESNKNCTNIQFSVAWYNDGKETYKTMNAWNAEKRFTRAYLDEDNDPVLRMDVDLEYKVSKEHLREQMRLWRSLVDDFEDHL